MTLLNNYHILIVKAIGATNNEPAKVKIISERFKQSVKIPFTNNPGASSPATDSAIEYLEKRGYVLIGKTGEGEQDIAVVSYYASDTSLRSVLERSKEKIIMIFSQLWLYEVLLLVLLFLAL